MLLHRRVLPGENLKKRGIYGPHRCRTTSENLDHLFVDCPFAQSVWTHALQGLQVIAPSQIVVNTLFEVWQDQYPRGLKYKSLWKWIWSSIPKFICWKIWHTRNDLIFNNTAHTPQTVVAKAKAYLLEALNKHSANLDTSLTPKERNWMGTPLAPSKTEILARPSSNPSWRIRSLDEEFQA